MSQRGRPVSRASTSPLRSATSSGCIACSRCVGWDCDWTISQAFDDEGVGLLATVRRHLEHVERELDKQRQLRERLQDLLDALERSVEVSAEQLIGTLEAMAVIETNAKDVLIWHSHSADAPPGTPLPHPPRDGQRAVLLEQQGGERVMPNWIGEPEAKALALALSGRTARRPLSADLTARLPEVGDLVVEGRDRGRPRLHLLRHDRGRQQRWKRTR